MPKLPDATILGPSPVPRSERPIVGVRTPGIVAEASVEEARTLGQAGRQVGELTITMEAMVDANDKAAAAALFARASDAWRERSLRPDGIYGKRPEELFGEGKTSEDLLKGTQGEIDAIGNGFAGRLKNPQQQRLFGELWRRHRAGELDTVARTLAAKHLTYREDALKAVGITTDRLIAEHATEAELSWRDIEEAKIKAARAIGSYAAAGAAADEIEKKIQASRQALNAAGLRGWFRTNENRTGAAEQLLTGRIADPTARAYYEALDPDSRKALTSELITAESRLSTIENQRRKDEEETAKQTDTTLAKRVLFEPGIPLPERQRLYDAIRTSPHIDIPLAERMDRFIRNGGRDEGLDVEGEVLEIERQIRNGEIATDDQLLVVVGRQPGVSFNTTRTRLMPLLEAQGDRRWEAALSWGEAQLGYDRSAAASGIAVFADATNRALRLRADMIEFRRTNPEGDFWAYARQQVEQLRTAAGSRTNAVLFASAQAYERALADGNTKRIESARTNLNNSLLEVGVPLSRLLSPGFDPLAYLRDEYGK